MDGYEAELDETGYESPTPTARDPMRDPPPPPRAERTLRKRKRFDLAELVTAHVENLATSSEESESSGSDTVYCPEIDEPPELWMDEIDED